jgi:hypothetical protein
LLLRVERNELLHGAREGVEQFQGHLSGTEVKVRRRKAKAEIQSTGKLWTCRSDVFNVA